MSAAGLRTALAILFTVFGSPAYADLRHIPEVTSEGLRIVLVEGQFTANDNIAQFTSAIRLHNATVVSFNSLGGNIYKAIELGRAIRSLGLNTVQVRGRDCASACALAFLGGVYRGAQPGSIGVHKSSFADDSLNARDAVSAIQELTAEIIAYIVEMGGDPSLLQLAFRYESDDIRYLSGSEMELYRVTYTSDQETPPARRAQPQQEPTPSQDEVSIPTPTKRPDHVAFPPAEKEWPPDTVIIAFVRTVIDSHSRDSSIAIRDVIQRYNGKVSYFGKETSLRDIVADKRAYFERWPERHYALREETVSVSCSPDVCQVRGIMDWVVRSLPRNRKASGAATFRYQVVDYGSGLRIVSEDSTIVPK